MKCLHEPVDRCLLLFDFRLIVETCWTSSFTGCLELDVQSPLCSRVVSLISINYFYSSNPQRTVRKGTHPTTCISDCSFFKFHHFKIVYFSQKWAAFLLGIQSMVPLFYMTSWPCLSSGCKEANQIHWGQVLAFSCNTYQTVCPHTCLAVVYSMCLPVDVVLMDVILLIPVPFASAYRGLDRKHKCSKWEGHSEIIKRFYTSLKTVQSSFDNVLVISIL